MWKYGVPALHRQPCNLRVFPSSLNNTHLDPRTDRSCLMHWILTQYNLAILVALPPLLSAEHDFSFMTPPSSFCFRHHYPDYRLPSLKCDNPSFKRPEERPISITPVLWSVLACWFWMCTWANQRVDCWYDRIWLILFYCLVKGGTIVFPCYHSTHRPVNRRQSKTNFYQIPSGNIFFTLINNLIL